MRHIYPRFLTSYRTNTYDLNCPQTKSVYYIMYVMHMVYQQKATRYVDALNRRAIDRRRP